jgi:hypothetical protein
MPRAPIRVALLSLAALALVAASPRREYLRSLDSSTGELKIYRTFDTALILRATYLDGPMRAAIAAERRRLVNPAPENHQAFVARMAADQAEYHDVVFSASSPLPAARTFGESDAGWVIWLEADGVRQELISVERIRRPTGLHLELYAHKTIWADLWIARFAKTVADPDHVVLHVGSGYGNGDVEWGDLGARRGARAAER